MSLKGRKFSIEHREKLRQAQLRNPNRFWLGKKRSDMIGDKNPAKTEESRRKISIAHKGKIVSIDTRIKQSISHTGHPLPEETKINMRKSAKRGCNNHMWRGGVTPSNVADRISIEYKLWRSAVFARDGFICQKCKKRGGKLRPHHILNFSKYIDLRFAIDNGITFCDECHKEFHKKYGIKNNTIDQIYQFLKITINK